MLKKLVFGLFIFMIILSPVMCYADNTQSLINVQKQLSAPDIIKGTYTQTRKMHLIKKPLVSSGTFTLSRNSGLSMHQIKPFESNLTVTDTKIEQKIMDNPPMVITKQQQPAVFVFSSVFLSVFHGHDSQIKENFDIKFEGDTSKWSMTLTPKTSPMNKAIMKIELSGDKTIKNITVFEAKDNTMIIKLHAK